MRVRYQMERVSGRLTQEIALRRGKTIPFCYVIEYPKSGGTWLSQMLSSYLDLPFPRHAMLPIAFPSLIQAHWRYDSRLSRAVYLYRDGRDVMVSLYFHRMRQIDLARRNGWSHPLERDYQRLWGQGYDPNDSLTHLATFIELEAQRPRSAPLFWSDHVEAWTGQRSAPCVSYEQLRSDPVLTLRRVVEALIGEEAADQALLESVVKRYSFERQASRPSGQEDRSSFLRKGIVGDWKNHFSLDARQVFEDRAGEQLRSLGYTRDSSWAHA